MLAPNSEIGKFMKKPFVKFITHSASYAFFLSKYLNHSKFRQQNNTPVNFTRSFAWSRKSASGISSTRMVRKSLVKIFAGNHNCVMTSIVKTLSTQDSLNSRALEKARARSFTGTCGICVHDLRCCFDLGGDTIFIL